MLTQILSRGSAGNGSASVAAHILYYLRAPCGDGISGGMCVYVCLCVCMCVYVPVEISAADVSDQSLMPQAWIEAM